MERSSWELSSMGGGNAVEGEDRLEAGLRLPNLSSSNILTYASCLHPPSSTLSLYLLFLSLPLCRMSSNVSPSPTVNRSVFSTFSNRFLQHTFSPSTQNFFFMYSFLHFLQLHVFLFPITFSQQIFSSFGFEEASSLRTGRFF